MKSKTIRRIISHYGLEAKKIYPFEKGYRNRSYRVELENGDSVNLIIYKDETDIIGRIKAANLVGNYLAERNFPSRNTYINKIIQLKFNNSTRLACLYNYLSGQTIPWEGYTMKHIKELGKALSDMHSTLSNYKSFREDLPNEIVVSKTQLCKMKKYFSDSGVSSAMELKLGLRINDDIFNDIERELDVVNESKAQALHMDFVRSNILFDETNKIVGVLDFEKASYGPRILDIARTLAFLIIDCKFKSEDKVRKYFLSSGYGKRGKVDLPNLQRLEILLELNWFYDFYKFLKHNPYEFLDENEHFIRTKKILLERGLIKYSH